MKRFILDFIRRGLIAAGIGPMVFAVVYLILKNEAGVETLTVNQAATGIFSLSALAFIAGGMNVIYQIERLSLMAAVSVHGIVLYAGYLGTYLINDWLELGTVPILVFTGIFAVGYLLIWAAIYTVIRRRTAKINRILVQNRSGRE